jgi:para-nitrobenzyl esterase
MRLSAFACCALPLALACGGEPPVAADPASRRSPPAGELVGSVGRYGSHVWRGIPYAEPPLGELRWRAPLPARRFAGVREALASGPLCTQLASPLGGDDSAPPGTPVGAEDCLTLDVYAPRVSAEALPARSGLPVMVWLHGGGNVVGGARFYDGGQLAQSQNVVVVIPQYRLGPLGWFRHAALRAGGGSAEDLSGNFGTLDQIRALEWVHENVAAFGGDPTNVTLFGESAGGRNVFALLLSPRARGLFQRAIVQSGGTETLPVHEAEQAADAEPPGHVNSSSEVVLRLIAPTAPDRAAARAQVDRLDPQEIARALRARPAAELLAAYLPDALEDLPEVPQLFRDGTVIADGDALELAAAGRAAPVPVILGSTRDEYRVFLFLRPHYVQQILGFLPRVRDERAFLATAEHVSNLWKATGVDEPAARLERAGALVFAYRFDWDEEPNLLLADASLLIGAGHGFDVPFVFGHWELGRRARVLFGQANRPGREELSAAMQSYWTQFALSGDPGRGRDGELPLWKPWSRRPGGEKYLRLDTAAGGGIQMASSGASRAGVVLAVDKDPRLPSVRDKCGVYYELARFGRGFRRADYPTAGTAGCAEYPFEDFPWE